MSEAMPEQFAVYCEAAGYDRPLYLSSLTFARLIEHWNLTRYCNYPDTARYNHLYRPIHRIPRSQ
jgi:hypothetical protein